MQRKNWIDARAKAGLSQRDVDLWFLSRLPDQPELRLDQAKLSRFEKSKSAKVHPTTLAFLAECYGRLLSELDPEAAAAVNSLRDLLVDVRTCDRRLADRAA